MTVIASNRWRPTGSGRRLTVIRLNCAVKKSLRLWRSSLYFGNTKVYRPHFFAIDSRTNMSTRPNEKREGTGVSRFVEHSETASQSGMKRKEVASDDLKAYFQRE